MPNFKSDRELSSSKRMQQVLTLAEEKMPQKIQDWFIGQLKENFTLAYIGDIPLPENAESIFGWLCDLLSPTPTPTPTPSYKEVIRKIKKHYNGVMNGNKVAAEHLKQLLLKFFTDEYSDRQLQTLRNRWLERLFGKEPAGNFLIDGFFEPEDWDYLAKYPAFQACIEKEINAKLDLALGRTTNSNQQHQL